jgi:hypothetical protein
VNSIPSKDDEDEAAPRQRGDAHDPEVGRPRRRFDNELDHHSFVTGALGWLPVADGRGIDAPPAR